MINEPEGRQPQKTIIESRAIHDGPKPWRWCIERQLWELLDSCKGTYIGFHLGNLHTAAEDTQHIDRSFMD